MDTTLAKARIPGQIVFPAIADTGDGDDPRQAARQRVREGGHNVPEAVIRRRFHSGWRNFEMIYRELVDEWVLYDNSGEAPLLLAEENRR